MKIFIRYPLLLESHCHPIVPCDRLVRCLLGFDAIAVHKCACGMPLTVLGIAIHILEEGLKLVPDREKCLKWSAQIRDALERGILTAGEASKLAGRLSWASSACFKRAGRTLLNPLFRRALRQLCSHF